MEIVGDVLRLYEQALDTAKEITFPITQFAKIGSDGSATEPDPIGDLAKKAAIHEKIEEFDQTVQDFIASLGDRIKQPIINAVLDALGEPILSLLTTFNSKIEEVVNPIKDKINELIKSYIKEPLSQITTFISSAIQPVVSSLPSVIQLAVKLALKKVLQVLMGLPIKFLLKAITSPVEDIIGSVVEKLQDKVMQIIATSMRSLVAPLIEPIQKDLLSKIPLYNMDNVKNKVKELVNKAEGYLELPKIYIDKADNLIQPFKTFAEINWSDTEEVTSMILGIIHEYSGELPSEVTSLLNEVPEVKGIVESVYKVGSDIWGSGHQDVDDGEDGDGYKYYKRFESKEDFMNLFLGQHAPVLGSEALLGVEPYDKLEVKTWLTNEQSYVEIEINKVKGNYICNPTDNTISVKISDTVSVQLEPKHIYESEEIPHIKKNQSDPEVGTDIVPKVDSNNHPISLVQQEMNDKGELLYKFAELLPGASSTEIENNKKTFNEITNLLYVAQKNSMMPDTTIIGDIVNKLNELLSSGTPIDNNTLINKIKETQIYSVLSNPTNNKVSIDTGNSEDPVTGQPVPLGLYITGSYNIVLKGNTTPLQPLVEIIENTSTNISFSISTLTTNVNVNPVTTPSETTEGEGEEAVTTKIPGETPIKIQYSFIIKDSSTSDAGSEEKLYLVESSGSLYNMSSQPVEEIGFKSVKPIFTASLPDSESGVFYSWVMSKVGEVTNLDSVKDLINMDNVDGLLSEMIQMVISAIGQEGKLDLNVLLKAVLGKLTDKFKDIATLIEPIMNLLQSFFEKLDDFKQIGDIIDTIASVGDKVNEIAQTAGPALEATAKAAAAVAIQNCSMSQSATGTDFNFTSGMNYNLSTTTDSRLQLPYCKELGREQFLEPNCKVLVLAVGAGKQNLYVVDILS